MIHFLWKWSHILPASFYGWLLISPSCLPGPTCKASVDVGAMHVLGWKQKIPSPGKDVLDFYKLDYYCYFDYSMAPQAARPAPLPGQQVTIRKQKRATRNCLCCLFFPEKIYLEPPAGGEASHHCLLQGRDWRWEAAYGKARDYVG